MKKVYKRSLITFISSITLVSVIGTSTAFAQEKPDDSVTGTSTTAPDKEAEDTTSNTDNTSDKKDNDKSETDTTDESDTDTSKETEDKDKESEEKDTTTDDKDDAENDDSKDKKDLDDDKTVEAKSGELILNIEGYDKGEIIIKTASGKVLTTKKASEGKIKVDISGAGGEKIVIEGADGTTIDSVNYKYGGDTEVPGTPDRHEEPIYEWIPYPARGVPFDYNYLRGFNNEELKELLADQKARNKPTNSDAYDEGLGDAASSTGIGKDPDGVPGTRARNEIIAKHNIAMISALIDAREKSVKPYDHGTPLEPGQELGESKDAGKTLEELKAEREQQRKEMEANKAKKNKKSEEETVEYHLDPMGDVVPGTDIKQAINPPADAGEKLGEQIKKQMKVAQDGSSGQEANQVTSSLLGTVAPVAAMMGGEIGATIAAVPGLIDFVTDLTGNIVGSISAAADAKKSLKPILTQAEQEFEDSLKEPPSITKIVETPTTETAYKESTEIASIQDNKAILEATGEYAVDATVVLSEAEKLSNVNEKNTAESTSKPKEEEKESDNEKSTTATSSSKTTTPPTQPVNTAPISDTGSKVDTGGNIVKNKVFEKIVSIVQ